MKRKKIEINYKPLNVHLAIVTVGSVAPIQTYDAASGTYEADYRLTPLVLFPQCTVIDAGTSPAKTVNASLVNMKWYETIDRNRILISSSNANYEIITSGSNKGQIKVKKNVALLHPITLELYAEYLDTRTDQLLVFRVSQLVSSVNATNAQPVLTLDSNSTSLWNPLEDPVNQTITAKLMAGTDDLTAQTAKRRFFWYKLRANGSLTAAGSDEFDIDIVSVNDNVLVINRELMGEKETYVCRATYSGSGSPEAAPDNSSPTASTTIVRRLPDYDYDIINIPNRIASDVTSVKPKVQVTGPQGIITNAMQELRATWYKTNTVIGEGESPRLTARDVTSGLLGVDLVDKGNYKMLATGDNKILVTGDNKILIVK